MENWTMDYDAANPVEMYLANNPIKHTVMHVQDLSEGNNDVLFRKQEQAVALAGWAAAQPNPNDVYAQTLDYTAPWVMNFTSIENSGSESPLDNTNGYKGGSSVMGPHMVEYIAANKGKGPLGIFISDFVLRSHTLKRGTSDSYYNQRGDELVYNIIDNNFTADASGKTVVERFSLSDALMDLDSDPYDGRTVFLRNPATGLLLGAGANYGSHAVLDPSGEPLHVARVGDEYTFTSDFGYMYPTAEGYLFMDGGTDNAVKWTVKNVRHQRKNYVMLQAQLNGSTVAMKAFKYSGKEAYYFNPLYWIDEAPADANDPMQLWEVVYEADRYAQIETLANPERPMGCSFVVPASGFGNGDKDSQAWTQWQWNPDYSTVTWHYNNENGTVYSVATKQTYTLSYPVAGERSRWSLTSPASKLPWTGKYRFRCQIATSADENTSVTVCGHNIPMKGRETISAETSLADAGKWMKAGNGWVEYEFDGQAGSDFTVVFKKTNNTSTTMTYFGNMSLEFLGDNPAMEKIAMSFPEHYNTMMLPFDADAASLNAAGYIVRKAEGLRNWTSPEVEIDGIKTTIDYHVIDLSDEVGTIEANTPYVVVNENIPLGNPGRAKAPAVGAPAVSQAHTFIFEGHPTNYLNEYADAAGILTGVSGDTPVDFRQYVMDKNETQGFQYFGKNMNSSADRPVTARRAYIKPNTSGAVEEMILFDTETDITTGVDDVTIGGDDIGQDDPVDVFTIAGVHVRAQVPMRHALGDLDPGVYIIRSATATRKMLVK